MRVFIADDESLIRKSLKSMLQEVNVPIQLVGEAINGEDMVLKVSETQPDLAFVDIKMPKLNGLEAIKIGKTVSPHTEWVILTGFSEFDYAKEAIQLGAANYLLKPVGPEELEKVLQELFAKHQEYLIRKNQEFKNDMITIYHGYHSIDEFKEDMTNSKRILKCVVFYIDGESESQKAESIKKLFSTLEKKMERLLLPNIRNALFSLKYGEPISIVSYNCSEGNRTVNKVEQYFQHLRNLVGRSDNKKQLITMIEGDACSSLSCLYSNIQDIENLAHLRILLGCGKKWCITDLKNNTHHEKLSLLLIQLSNYYTKKMYLEYMQTLGELSKQLQKVKVNEDEKHHIKIFLQVSIGCVVDKNKEVLQWMQMLEEYGNRLLIQNQQSENQRDMVDQVVSIIETHYMNDIGIGQIAEKLGVTPNYLSTLFRKKTGITFMKYLTNIRMLKAKELLTKPDMQVQQVAEKVGYYSARHFTKIFTEHVGCYPSEYRKKLSLKER